MGFAPLNRADASGEGAGTGRDWSWRRVRGGNGSLTRGTDQGGGRTSQSLAREGLLDHVARDGLTHLNGQFLEVGELGIPRKAVETINPVEKLLGDALKQMVQLGEDDGGFRLGSHDAISDGNETARRMAVKMQAPQFTLSQTACFRKVCRAPSVAAQLAA